MKRTKRQFLIGFLLVVLLVGSIPLLSFLFRETRIPADAEFEIQLQRTACYGTCPIYQVTINQAGEVVYIGNSFVDFTGEHRSVISQDELSELRRAFERIDFFSLKDSYTDMGATDFPSAIVSLTVNGREKVIDHYHGDFNAPEELSKLESEIDRVANTTQWIGGN
jgi:hypothetical protein